MSLSLNLFTELFMASQVVAELLVESPYKNHTISRIISTEV